MGVDRGRALDATRASEMAWKTASPSGMHSSKNIVKCEGREPAAMQGEDMMELEGSSAVTYIDTLPEEMLMLLLAPLGEVELCVLSCTCSRFRCLVRGGIEPLWAGLYQRRWRMPPRSQAADDPSQRLGRLEFVRRHKQDARVLTLLRRVPSSLSWVT